MADLSELLENLSPDPNVRGRQFERICQWYLLHDPGYRAQIMKVWLWDDWPGRWGPDAGIDLVAETHDGESWAIQSKAYDPKYQVTKGDLNTFLAESGTADFSYRLLIATTDGISPRAEATIQRLGNVGFASLSHLKQRQLDWPSSPEDLRAPPRPPKEPWTHQEEALKAVLEGFDSNSRGQLIMACGTGKTLVGLWVHERLASQRTVVLLPSIALVQQTISEWTANATQQFTFIAVCSDKTVVRDGWTQHTSELGIPVTTDPTAIAEFLSNAADVSRRVVFSTYQSSPRIADACSQHPGSGFDLVVADEAHRLAGSKDRDFSTVLDSAKIKTDRLLFATATPKRFTARVKRQAGFDDYAVASMDDETVFGPVLHTLTFGDAIKRDLLTDYQVVVVGVEEETCRAYARERRLVEREGGEVADAHTLASQIALAKAMRQYDLRRTISFHRTIPGAAGFAESLPDVVAWMPEAERPIKRLRCDHVKGSMPAGTRKVKLDQLRAIRADEHGLLTNAKCLTEGVDIPTLDGITFVNPKRSKIDIVQAVGRAIRKAPDKKVGTIVLPVYLSEDEDADATLSQSAFKDIWDVLKALRAHDDVLAEELDQYRRELGPFGEGRTWRLSKLELDLPARVGPEFADAFYTRLVEQTTSSWEFWFGLLERYVEQQGDALVPASWVNEQGHALGNWVGYQRQDKKRGELTQDRVERLNGIEGWEWDGNVAAFKAGIEHLRRFVAREGHARVPYGYVDEDGFALSAWLQNRRRDAKNGQLSQDQLGQLDEVGWIIDAHERGWDQKFEATVRFYEEHSRLPRRSEKQDDSAVGRWLAHQEGLSRRGELRADRERRLREAFPDWTVDRRAAQWEAAFREYEKYVERTERAHVPRDYEQNGIRLGYWYKRQFERFKRGVLDPSRERRLLPLTGWERSRDE